MIDTRSNPESAAARACAPDMDVAVIAPHVGGYHALMLCEPVGPNVATPLGQRLDPNHLLEEFGPALGVGDAIWRALSTVSADIVCVGSNWPLEPAQIQRLTQPLIENPALLLVSGVDDVLPPRSGPRAGDRLTELVARPLVARCEPALAGLRQPLLGSFAARRSLLRTLRFPAGTGARLSLLIDTARDHGSDAVAEVPLGGRSPDDRPLRELGADAAELIVAVHRRFVTAHAIVDEHLVCNPGTISRESRSPSPSGPRLSSSSPMTIRAGHVRRRPQRPR